MSIADRACIPRQKRSLMLRLLRVWFANPELRLGQLLVGALGGGYEFDTCLFYMEDFELVRRLEAWRP